MRLGLHLKRNVKDVDTSHYENIDIVKKACQDITFDTTFINNLFLYPYKSIKNSFTMQYCINELMKIFETMSDEDENKFL